MPNIENTLSVGAEIWLGGNAYRVGDIVADKIRVYPGIEKTEIRRIVLERAYDIEDEGVTYAD